MKILKISGSIILLLIIVFISIGLIWPSFTYESKVEVNAPAEQCWTVFTNPELMSQWMEGFKSISPISQQPGEVGSKYELVVEGNGEEMHLYETVTHFEVNKLYGMALDSDVLHNQSLISFETQGNSTVITATNEVSGNGIFWKPLLFMMKSTFQVTSDQQYGKLKGVIESQQ